MATVEETNLRAATDAWLTANPGQQPNIAAAIVYDEAQIQANSAEVAKAPPLPTALGAGQWTTLKTYLTDGAGPTDLSKVLTAADGFLANDQQPAFFRSLMLIYKTLRRQRAGN